MDKNNSYPLYQTMLDDLIRQIESGELKENEKLPSEQQLGKDYQVSRITVRRALAELEQRQYIYKKQGQGSFVLKKENQELGIRFLDTEQAIKNMGMQPKIILKSFQIIVDGSEESIRDQMHLGSDDYLYKIEQLYYADSSPVYFEKTYLKYNRFPGIKLSEISNNELIPFLIKKYQLRTIQFVKRLSAALITAKTRTLFKANVGDPLVKINDRGIDHQQLVYYSEATAVGTLPMFLIDE
ncbi:GntR family transcriptional regulator [Pediococcus ethanolidurans]|uniref:GntR family transcriptional regulator n=1 Tax=Pediococcus ethanolidurans TaxID=319653 RepID=UPI001C1F1BF2|nr:GntR family transcriptional regulator [Pediococcus ethanolidurans]MBU7555173.1 GntR family transcriptional regulator [Pediococcus ethanolidurans]MCV3328164.1 GntR family transcriptional regulator [Pediococcus ethanolidurans]